MNKININLINPLATNPRHHTKKHIYEITRSIKEFGFTNPILVDEKYEILAGHGRYLASVEMNLEEIPVLVISNLTKQQKKAYRIADNKLTEKGRWNENLLKIELEEIIKLDCDFDLELTGLEMGTIDNILCDNKIKEDIVPELPVEPTSVLGDIWILGKHKIICSNSLEKSSYKAILGSEKVAMIFTDPPYNVRVNGHVCGNGKTKHEEFKFASGEMSSPEFVSFLKTIFSNLKEFSKDGSIHYICMDWRHIEEVMTASKGIYDEFKNLCVWNKDGGGMGAMYRSKHELIFVFKSGTEKHTNNINLGKYGRYRTNVWDYNGANEDELKLHPTVKPVMMVYDAILDCSKKGELILDSFLGSGSILIACEKAGRKCVGIEYEPKYVDVSIERWEKLTGKDAKHYQTGKTYKEMKFWKGIDE